MAIKILIGGSPCTYWSIAKNNGRETQAEGMGWELFKNYLIAKEKFKPDYFLYENNKSAAQAIKDQIAEEFGVGVDPNVRFTYINSALVSAQNRQRFYVTNFGDIEQPEDRGILLKDILETGVIDKEKAYCLKHQAGNVRDYFKKNHTQIAYEPVNNDVNPKYLLKNLKTYDEKSVTLTANSYKGIGSDGTTTVIEPVIPVNETIDGKSQTIKAQYSKTSVANVCKYSSTYGATGVAEQVFSLPKPNGELTTSQSGRVYSTDGKSTTQMAGGGGLGGKTGLYAIPTERPESYLSEKMVDYAYKEGTKNFKQRVKILEDKSCPLTTEQNKRAGTTNYIPQNIETIDCDITDNGASKNAKPIYEVKDGFITIKGKQYPIKLQNGYYIIRKLTVTECARLQTMPDNYCKAVSDSQAYKGLGNGWTAEVIIHLLNHALKDVPRDEEIVVLSMYDGIGTGRYCLDKMGFTNVTYHAYEIDKYPIMVAMDNYPDIIQHGDAFAVREDDWKAPQTKAEWLDDLLAC